MSVLTVRNLDDETRARLKAQAHQHGRSMEGEVRAIITAAVAAPPPGGTGLGSRIAALFADTEWVDSERPLEPARAAVFDR